MMTDVSSFLDHFLSAYLFIYGIEVKTQIQDVLAVHSGLSVAPQQVRDTDGRLKVVLALTGTLDVDYRGSTYNIPVAVHLRDTFPYTRPRVAVVPTDDMLIKPGTHIKGSGEVTHAYLDQWSQQTSSLEQLLATLQRVFSASPPVYARPPAQAATANSHNKPSYGYGQYTNNSTSAHVQPHAQAGGYLTRVQTQPPLPPKPGAPPRLKPKPGQQGPHGEVGNGDGSSMDTSMNGSRNALRGVNTFSMGSGVGQSWQQPAQAQVTPPHPTHPQQAQAQRQYTQARRQYTQASSDSMYSISARGDTYNAHAYSTSQLPMMHAHSERDLRPTIGSPQSHPPSGGTQPQSPMASGQFGVADSTHALQQPQGYQHHRQPQEYPSQQQQYHQHQPPPPQSGQNQNGTPSHTSAFDELMGLDLSLSAPSPLSGAVAGGEPSANGVVPLASTSQQLVAGSSLASGHPPAQPHSATATVANSTAAVSVAKMNTEAHLVNDSLLDMDITPNAGPQGPDQQRLRRMRATKKLESRITAALAQREFEKDQDLWKQSQVTQYLNDNCNKINAAIDFVNTELQKTTDNIMEYHSCLAEIDETLQVFRHRVLPSPDDMVVTRYALEGQLMKLIAEANAIEDTFYYLVKALDRDSIDFDHYLKTVRILSRHQFMTRALIMKLEAEADWSRS